MSPSAAAAILSPAWDLVAEQADRRWVLMVYVKKAVRLIATVAVLPAFLAYRAASLLLGPEKAFPGWSEAFGLIPGLCGVYLRLAFYRLVLARCAPDVCIGFGTVLAHPGVRLGRGVYTGAYCSLGNVELGDDVLLASHVSITNGGRQHGIERLDVPIRMQPGVWIPVRIGEDSWIGEQAVVMADVGSHCVIGAGAVVTRPVPDFAIAVGVAAKVIG
jgi:virginiamycin A acetyltransferase